MQADAQAPREIAPPQRRRVRWGRIVLLFAGLLLLCVFGVGAWLLNQPEQLRSVIERAVSSFTGRALSIGGSFDVKLGRDISINAKQLVWANASWSNGPAMLSIGDAELVIDVRSILQPPLRIRHLGADDVVINVEWNEDGQSNWQLSTPAPDDPGQSQQPFQWLLQQANLQNVELRILPPEATDETRIRMQTLQQRQSTEDLYPGQEMTVSVTGFDWNNPPWATQASRLAFQSAEATFDFDSLLKPPFVVIDLAARDAQVDLEWDSEERFNWTFGEDPDSRDEETNTLHWLLNKAALQNVTLRLQHPSQSEPVLLAIEQATQQEDDSEFLVSQIAATVNGISIDLRGRVGPFAELLTAGAINFDMLAASPYSSLRLQGNIADLADLRKPNIRFAWTSPRVEDVFKGLNLPPVASGKSELSGSISTIPSGIDGQIAGNVGQFSVDGALHTENIDQLRGLSLEQLNGLSVKLQSSGPSAGAAGRIFAVKGLPSEPYELEIQAQDTAKGMQIEALRFATAGGTVTGSGYLHDFPALNKLDLDLQVSVANIARFSGLFPGGNIPAQPLRIDGNIRGDGNDSKDSISATASLGPLQAKLTGELTENPDFADSTFAWTLTAPDAQKSGRIFGIALRQPVPLDAKGNAILTASGINLRDTTVKLGSHTAKLKAQVPLSADGSSLSLDGNVSGKNLSNLINLFTTGQQLPTESYNLATQLEYADSKLTLRSMNGTVGRNKLQASGSLKPGKNWPMTDLRLSASGPQLADLLQRQNFAQLPDGPWSASGNLKITSSDTEIKQLSVQTQSGAIQGSLTVGWPNNPGRIDFDVTAKGSNLSKVLPVIANYEPAAVAFDLALRGKLAKQKADIAKLNGSIGAAQISLKGDVDFSGPLRSNGAALKIAGPRISDLGRLGTWVVPEAAFDISATLTGATDKLEARDFSLRYGASDLRGTIRFSRIKKLRVDVDLRSRQFDMRPFESLFFGDSTNSAAPAKIGDDTDRKKRARVRFIPDIPLPLEKIKSVDGSLQLSAVSLITRRYPFKNLDIDAILTDGNLDFDGASSFGGDGNAKVALDLLQKPGRKPRIEFSTTSRNVQYELNQIDQSLQGYNLIQNVDAYLVGDGTNLQEIAAGLNGYFWLRGGRQKIATNQFGFIFGTFLTGVIEKVNPFVKTEPYQTINCVVAFFTATDGVLKTSPAVLMNTDKLNIAATGTINLQNEKLALDLRANPRTGIGIGAGTLLNPFVGLRGTLFDPQVSLDPKGTLIEGGAAVATAGISLVAESLFKRWFGSRDPCTKLTNDARETLQKRDPAHVPAD